MNIRVFYMKVKLRKFYRSMCHAKVFKFNRGGGGNWNLKNPEPVP